MGAGTNCFHVVGEAEGRRSKRNSVFSASCYPLMPDQRRLFCSLRTIHAKVHGDVFRAPKHLMLFSALYGTGCQLAVLVFITILYAIAGPLHGDVYKERGEMVTAFIMCYTLTSFISGCVCLGRWGIAPSLRPMVFNAGLKEICYAMLCQLDDRRMDHLTEWYTLGS